MALLAYEGFDNYAANPTNPFAGSGSFGARPEWVLPGAINSNFSPGLFGGRAWNVSNTAAINTFVPISTIASTFSALIFGMHFAISNGSSQLTGLSFIFNWVDVNRTIFNTIRLSTAGTGVIQYYVGPGSSVLLSCGTTKIPDFGSWTYIECMTRFSTDPSSGSVEIRLNGSTLAELFVNGITLSTLATTGGAGIALGVVQISQPMVFDDFWIASTHAGSGANPITGFPSDTNNNVLTVETLFPNSTVSVNWTPSAGTNLAAINESSWASSPFNSVASSLSSAADTFGHATLASTPASIFAVDVFASLSKDNTTPQTASTVLVSSGTTVVGSSLTLETIYYYAHDMYLNDPSNSSAWTKSAVGNSFIGYSNR